MKYTVRTTKDGCIEKLELSNGLVFTRRSKKTDNGYEILDPDISEQMKNKELNEDIIHVADNLFDSITSLNFMKLSELDK